MIPVKTSTKIPASAEVVVIGSGPSGSMAAGLLAKDGFDVVILDRDSHPRMRVGENVIPRFWKYADLLGASDDIRAAGFVQKAGGIVQWNGQSNRMKFADFGYDRPGLHVDREEFDHILVNHAQRLGAKLHENVTVRRVEFADGFQADDFQQVLYDQGDGVKSITTRYVIDASGQSGLLSRQMKNAYYESRFSLHECLGLFPRLIVLRL